LNSSKLDNVESKCHRSSTVWPHCTTKMVPTMLDDVKSVRFRRLKTQLTNFANRI